MAGGKIIQVYKPKKYTKRVPKFSKYKKIYRRKRGRYIPRAPTTQANIPAIQKLRYAEMIYLTSTSGLAASYQFRCNGLYDPNRTGVGHQPCRFDQLSLLYARYCVLGAKIKVQYVGTYGQATTAMPFILALYLDDNATEDLPVIGDIENGKCKYKIINGFASQRCTIKGYFSAKKFFGITNIKDNIYDLGAVTSADPSDEAFWRIVIFPMDASSNVEARILVTIDYTALFSEPIDLAQS